MQKEKESMRYCAGFCSSQETLKTFKNPLARENNIPGHVDLVLDLDKT